MGEKVITSNDTILLRSRGMSNVPRPEGSGLVHNHPIPWQEKTLQPTAKPTEKAGGVYAEQAIRDLYNSREILKELGVGRRKINAAHSNLITAVARTENGREILARIEARAKQDAQSK